MTDAPKEDIMTMLNRASSTAKDVVSEVDEKKKDVEVKMSRQRKKSKELEVEIFGMEVTDIEKLKAIFQAIDTDGSGSLDEKELRLALERAGKKPTFDLVSALMKKYDTDGNGTMEFNEYQGMLKDWDTVTKMIEEEQARLAAAIAAAEPQQWPSGWGTPRSTTPEPNVSPAKKE